MLYGNLMVLFMAELSAGDSSADDSFAGDSFQ